MADTTTLPLRTEVPAEETWNLESIFSDPDTWQTTLEETQRSLPQLSEYRDRLSESPEVLLECLKVYEHAFRSAIRVLMYAMLESAVDTTNQDALGRTGQARGLMAKTEAATAFVEPELLGIGFDTLRQWAADNVDLAVYDHYFDDLERQQSHVLNGDVEEIMAMAEEPLGASMATYSAVTNADLSFEAARTSDGETYDVGQSSIATLLAHENRDIRKSAWENYADGYLRLRNALASTQQGAIQKDVFTMRARHYQSSLEASLDENNISTSVFHNLIDVFKNNLPTWHKYWDIRRRALHTEKMHVYDIKAPLSAAKVEVPYEDAVEWICDGMAPLGDEYVRTMRDGCTTGRWVDRAMNQGKRQGAFSAGTFDTQPFILLSYADDIFSLSTLAHELGHSMHSHYSRTHQPFVYSHYSLFVAEVASNFNQAMVRNHLFNSRKDEAFQLGLIEEAMSNFHRYFFIMPTLARWELEMHERIEEGKPVNSQILTDRCAELFKEGYGDGVELDHDRIGITWAQFGHMYRNFYVYQYATGISGAHALTDMVLNGGEDAAATYLEFLKAGGSKYPLDALQAAGVDLAKPEPVEKAFTRLADIVNRLGDIVG